MPRRLAPGQEDDEAHLRGGLDLPRHRQLKVRRGGRGRRCQQDPVNRRKKISQRKKREAFYYVLYIWWLIGACQAQRLQKKRKKYQ